MNSPIRRVSLATILLASFVAPPFAGAARDGGHRRMLNREWARYQDDLSWGGAACGLVAAEALLRFRNGDPEADKIMKVRRIALRRGLWSPSAGMYGPAAEQELLRALGLETTLIPISEKRKSRYIIRKALARGKPAIVSTYQHYFVVEGADPDRLFVGNTGRVMQAHGHAGAGRYMTIDEIESVGLGINGLIIMKQVAGRRK